jgi:hypothetical protein
MPRYYYQSMVSSFLSIDFCFCQNHCRCFQVPKVTAFAKANNIEYRTATWYTTLLFAREKKPVFNSICFSSVEIFKMNFETMRKFAQQKQHAD